MTAADGDQQTTSWSFSTGDCRIGYDQGPINNPGQSFTCGPHSADFLHASGPKTSGKARPHLVLVKRTFSVAAAASVRLTYSFTAATAFFGMQLQRAVPGVIEEGACETKAWGPPVTGHCTAWEPVPSATGPSGRPVGKGPHTLTIRKLFAGKPVRPGRYRLTILADAGSMTLTFTINS